MNRKNRLRRIRKNPLQQKPLKSSLQHDLETLVALGYLKQVRPGVYTLTPKGKSYVEGLL